jgi:shikimate 5-dehydrogenase
VIGAGGSARAAIYELLKRGAFVLIFNRTHQKGEILSKHFNIRSYPLNQIEEFSKEIDLLINTTSVGMPPLFDLPIPKSAFPRGKHVMDLILFPKETLFLQMAKEYENKIIFGIEMFYMQAILQFKSWFENIDENQAFSNLTDAEKIYKLDLLNLFDRK